MFPNRSPAFPFILGCLWVSGGGLPVKGDTVRFNQDIRPILSDKCFFCHGPDVGNRKAKLRLDLETEAKADRDGDFVILPGHPDESELIARVFTDDPDDRMPPPESHRSLTPAQKELLKEWIVQGAPWEGHWAYQKPSKQSPSAIRNDKAVANPIDRYILAGLERRNLKHSKQADRRTLIRRLSLDLTGLPPTPVEVQAFLQDKSKDAYERQVDRLLASAHYGERMAVPWLDAVRYADTVGYHGDQNQNVFPYRDYVVASFNRNKPFDEFITEQLAGDLLDDPTPEQLVATGFNRLNMMTREGGAQTREYLAKYGADRVRTVTSTFLGSTFACAECHDHKFDPISTRDFYAFKAFFADIKQYGVYSDYGYTPNPDLKGFDNNFPFPPEIAVENAYLQQRQAEKEAELEKLVNEALDPLNAVEDEEVLQSWITDLKGFVELHDAGWAPAMVMDVTSSKDTEAEVLADGSVLFAGKPKGGDVLKLELQPYPGGVAGMRLEVLPDVTHSNRVARAGKTAFDLRIAAKVKRADGRQEKLTIIHGEADRSRPTYVSGRLAQPHERWKSEDGSAGELHTVICHLMRPIHMEAGDRLIVELRSAEIGRVRLATTPVSPALCAKPGDFSGVTAAAGVKPEDRTADEQRVLQLAYLTCHPSNDEFQESYAALHHAIRECQDGIGYCQIVETREPETVRVLPRGDWQAESGEVVEPAPPHFLPGIENPEGRRLNRLDLARWIASSENPLTARVFVNRVWKIFLGAGLSGVLDDLGSQGEWPTHPELLDWLAIEFMESGWDVKQLVKGIVLSDTYRRSSNASSQLVAADPDNRLLGRQSPRRLPAELVRDNALAISGLLNPDVGGPSVHPYQPAGHYEHLNFPEREYQASAADRQYRRGLYSHWQRTFLHPMLANFDAPSREECAADRSISNTPQQALTLLNDPTFVEAARHFAVRVVDAVDSPRFNPRLAFAFSQALAREPSRKERRSLSAFYRLQLDYYQAEADEAVALLNVGQSPSPAHLDKAELAAWTSVCRVILNLHETITRY